MYLLFCFTLRYGRARTIKKKILRSTVNVPNVASRSKHVLPHICIICKKEKLFVTDRVSRHNDVGHDDNLMMITDLATLNFNRNLENIKKIGW